MFFLQTLIFFDILCFKLNRRGFTELPFSIININFKLLIICISKIFLPLEGVEQFTYIPKHYFEQEWDFYRYFGKYLKHLNHSIKSIITYNYRLGFLIQLNISEVLIFFLRCLFIESSWKCIIFYFPDDMFALLVLFIIFDVDESSLHRLKSFQNEKVQTGDIGSTFYQKWWIISSVSGHFKLFLYP